MLGLSWEPVGVSLGDLEPSWVDFEVVVGGFGALRFFTLLGSDFETKRHSEGGILGAKAEQKLILGASWSLCEAILGRLGAKLGWFWLTFGPPNFLNIF